MPHSSPRLSCFPLSYSLRISEAEAKGHEVTHTYLLSMIEVSEYRRRRSSPRKVREMKTTTTFLRQRSMMYTV